MQPGCIIAGTVNHQQPKQNKPEYRAEHRPVTHKSFSIHCRHPNHFLCPAIAPGNKAEHSQKSLS